MKNAFRPVILLALAMVAACGDSSTGVDGNEATGSLAFSYSSIDAPITGTFEARGAVRSNSEEGTWAAAAREDGDAAVIANQVSGSAVNTTIISLPGVKLGAVALSDDCEESCASLSFVIQKVVGASERIFMCDVTSGSVNVASLSAERIKGTFSGNGTCFSIDDPNEPSISVTNGSFDTPVVTVPISSN